jgi:hypothetical protein
MSRSGSPNSARPRAVAREQQRAARGAVERLRREQHVQVVERGARIPHVQADLLARTDHGRRRRSSPRSRSAPEQVADQVIAASARLAARGDGPRRGPVAAGRARTRGPPGSTCSMRSTAGWPSSVRMTLSSTCVTSSWRADGLAALGDHDIDAQRAVQRDREPALVRHPVVEDDGVAPGPRCRTREPADHAHAGCPAIEQVQHASHVERERVAQHDHEFRLRARRVRAGRTRPDRPRARPRTPA